MALNAGLTSNISIPWLNNNLNNVTCCIYLRYFCMPQICKLVDPAATLFLSLIFYESLKV